MSRAKERALEAYPVLYSERHGYDNTFKDRRESYIKGYTQAEKGLELGLEDINNIKLLIDQVECDYVEMDKKLYTKDFYEEVLKRFKDLKEK